MIKQLYSYCFNSIYLPKIEGDEGLVRNQSETVDLIVIYLGVIITFAKMDMLDSENDEFEKISYAYEEIKSDYDTLRDDKLVFSFMGRQRT